jgi:uncharacterized membrane protein
MVALVVVATAGLMVRAPLQRVPENAIRFVVGSMILSVGTFWTLGSLAGPDTRSHPKILGGLLGSRSDLPL